MHCDPTVKEHLHHAKDQVRNAMDAATERIVSGEVRGHLRDAARHMLKAGLAALDAEEHHRAARTAARHAAAAAHSSPHPTEPPPVT